MGFFDKYKAENAGRKAYGLHVVGNRLYDQDKTAEAKAKHEQALKLCVGEGLDVDGGGDGFHSFLFQKSQGLHALAGIGRRCSVKIPLRGNRPHEPRGQQ